MKVRTDGAVKVLDFGLAKAWQSDLFSADRFVAIDVPTAVEASLLKASRA